MHRPRSTTLNQDDQLIAQVPQQFSEQQWPRRSGVDLTGVMACATTLNSESGTPNHLGTGWPVLSLNLDLVRGGPARATSLARCGTRAAQAHLCLGDFAAGWQVLGSEMLFLSWADQWFQTTASTVEYSAWRILGSALPGVESC